MISNEDVEDKTEYGLSIIIPTYNVEKYIAGCLKSILKQIADNSIEITCIDGGSEDKTIEIIKGYTNNYKTMYMLKKLR